MAKKKIVLASASPRRQELLQKIIKEFTVICSSCKETVPDGMASEDVAEYLAQQKAKDVAQQHPEHVVIGADTIVLAEGIVLGKPATPQAAKEMLELLSGKWHRVITGVAVVQGEVCHSFRSMAQVRFAPMCQEEIAWYLATGEPFDKAGAYGIQGYGSLFVQQIDGDYFTVMGLPVQGLYQKLREICPQNLVMREKLGQ